MSEEALQIRRQWMTMLGLGPEEIEEYCKEGTPADLQEELLELEAMHRLQEMWAKMDDE